MVPSQDAALMWLERSEHEKKQKIVLVIMQPECSKNAVILQWFPARRHPEGGYREAKIRFA